MNEQACPLLPSSATRPATLGGDPLALRHVPLRRVLERIQAGRLALTLPDGRCVTATGAQPGPHAHLHLRRWRPALRLLLQGDLGLALSYRDGDWHTPDLTALLCFGIANDAALSRTVDPRGPSLWLSKLLHRAQANTRRGSRHNIAAHYDLGNRFYTQWLDDSMLYSSALYAEGEADTLEAAQARRLDRIIELLDLRPGQRVLEIGCGWGTLAAEMARRCDVQVVGVTLSKEQLAFAQQRAARWGVADRVELRLQDYRDIEGRFDRIVSIEMIEAVGQAYWPLYFDVLRDRLVPGGLALLQAITIDERSFPRYSASPDFIQRCIFPGGMLPTVEAMAHHAARSGLSFHTELRFGRDYARTLVEWRRRFLAAWPAIEAQGFDAQFQRLWEYYLCYCEAGFLAGRVNVGLYRLSQ